MTNQPTGAFGNQAMVSMLIVPTPDPKKQAIFRHPANVPPEPFMKGDGGTNYLCGECGMTLLERISGAQVSNIVFQCPRCKKYNATRT
jgi:hypothetical protein